MRFVRDCDGQCDRCLMLFSLDGGRRVLCFPRLSVRASDSFLSCVMRRSGAGSGEADEDALGRILRERAERRKA